MKKGLDYIGVGVGAVVINKNREILLLLRRKPPEADHWTIPGGAVEFGEQLEDAVIREVREEVGIECKVIRLIRVTDHILPNEGVHWVSPAFLLEHVEGQPINREPLAHKEIGWFSVDNLPDNITITTRLAVKSFLGNAKES